MPRQRKQKLSSLEDLPVKVEMNLDNDPFLNNIFKDSSIPQNSTSPPDYEDIFDSFAEPVGSSNWAESAEWFLDQTAPLYTDGILDVNSFLGLDETALSLLEEDAPTENKETFQDLKFTSTPKSRTSLDSGICNTSESRTLLHSGICNTPKSRTLLDSGICNSPSLLKSSPQQDYKTVLHDITESHKFNIQEASSFISIADVNDISNIHTVQTTPDKRKLEPPPNLPQTSKKKRNIPIIRKRTQATSSKPKLENDITEQEQLMYYTGLNTYEKAVGVVKYMRVSVTKLSKYKTLLLTFMKLRLGLEWKDLAYRFEIDEPSVPGIFLSTMAVLSKSVVDLLPWQLPKVKNNRVTPQLFYAYESACRFGKLMIIMRTDKNQILFVTPLYSISQSSSLLLYMECNKFLIPGDELSIFNSSVSYRVSTEDGQLVFIQIAKTNEPNESHVKNVISKLENYALTNPARWSEDYNICQVIQVCCAFTNFNFMDVADPLTLMKMYHRSEFVIRSAKV